MYLIVGLGNPGKEYEITKHNTGYMVLDYIAKQNECEIGKKKFNGLHCKTKINGEDVILLKPITFMNLSGESVIQYLNYFDIPIENLIVIYDDIQFDIGEFKIKRNGTGGSHNGMKSVVNSIDSIEFPRIRVGINDNVEHQLIDYVLSNYTKEQIKKLEDNYNKIYDAIIMILDGKIEQAMNKYN